MDYLTDALKKYADFTGRATRKQYWMFVLFYAIIYAVLAVIDVLLGTLFLAVVYSLVFLIPNISIAARRLHDTGRTGWWQLIGIVPVIGLIVLIFFLVQESQDDNEYGPRPESA